MNQLEDRADLRGAACAASQAGVRDRPDRPRLLRAARRACPGVSEQHPRSSRSSAASWSTRASIYFHNGADDPLDGEFYIGSADWMERNLSERVEAVTPIETPAHRARLWEILQIMLHDRRQAWDMQPDGTYVQRQPESDAGPHAAGTHQSSRI